MTASGEAANEALTDAAAALDAAAVSTGGHYELEDAIRASIRAATDSHEMPWLQDALQAVTYRLRVGDKTTDFEPYLILADGTTDPPRIDAQPDERIERWARLQAATTQPVVRSRLAHLIVNSERAITGKARVDLANAAAADYLATPLGWGAGLDRADALLAAAGLAKQFGNRARRDQALAAITDSARDELAQAQPAAGIALALTHYLVLQIDAPADVDNLLAQARVTWAADIHNLDEVIGQQILRAAKDPARKAALAEERVRAWLDAATAAPSSCKPPPRTQPPPATRACARSRPNGCKSSPSKTWG